MKTLNPKRLTHLISGALLASFGLLSALPAIAVPINVVQESGTDSQASSNYPGYGSSVAIDNNLDTNGSANGAGRTSSP